MRDPQLRALRSGFCPIPARLVRNYGVRLMPELYAHLNPMPFEAAAEMEKDLAGDLRHEGYTVAGGT